MFQKRRVSLPWIRSKPETNPKLDRRHSAVNAGTSRTVSDQDSSSTSKLLTLPAEIQEHIWDFIFVPWTMVILTLDLEEQSKHYADDPTVTLERVGSKLVSGPPGCNVLLTCRSTYLSARHRFGSLCTGHLRLGRTKSKLRRRFDTYLTSHCKLRRYYSQIHTISVCFALDNGRCGLNFRRLFPNVRYADCVVYEGGYGPLLRLNDSIESFLIGQHDGRLTEWTRPIVDFVMGRDGWAFQPLLTTSCPWDDRDGVISVKVLGSIAAKPSVVLGLNYRWEGTEVKVLSRVVRDKTDLKFWQHDMPRGRYKIVDIEGAGDEIPERFLWVQALKWWF